MRKRKGMSGFAKRLMASLNLGKTPYQGQSVEDQIEVERFLDQPYQSPDHVSLYTPGELEPCVFAHPRDVVSRHWMAWREVYIRKVAARDGFESIPSLPRTPASELIHEVLELRVRLMGETATNPDRELPSQPPAMHIDGTKILSLAWVLDTVYRDKVTIEEAIGLSIALEKM